MSNEISVIICAYTERRWNDLVECVEAIRNQTLPPMEIIGVIDHNRALFERAQQEIPGVTFVENSESQGLSGARNTGISIAKGDILAFIDEDAVAMPDWLEQLQTEYAQEHIMGVGGTIEPMWLNGRPRWFPQEFDWVVGCTYLGMPQTPSEVRNLIGCNMSFRREVFDAVGGFQTGIGRIGTLPVGCEETEWCIRAKQNNPKGMFLFKPTAKVKHRVPAERGQWKYFYTRCYSEGKSKALVADLVGAQDGLASERNYTMRTLPMGTLKGLSNFFFRFDPFGILRSGAIVIGLLTTTAGYLLGTMSSKLTTSQKAAIPQKTT